jgi:DNA replication protein
MRHNKLPGFPGFPAGKMATTPVPNLFFSDLLPQIDHLGELKVTLHLLWLIGRKRGPLRYARLSELLADERLLEGLRTRSHVGEDVLRDALERATARGTILHASVHRGELVEDWYLVNGPNGRDAIARLRSGELDLLADVAEDVQIQVERPNIFVLYEQNIGLLTPMIADELREAERSYPEAWIADALREAVAANKRSWRYALRILERWRAEGKDEGHTAAQANGEPAESGRAYVPEGYEDLIEH